MKKYYIVLVVFFFITEVLCQNSKLADFDASMQFILYNNLDMYSKSNNFDQIIKIGLKSNLDSTFEAGKLKYFISQTIPDYIFFKTKNKLEVMKILVHQKDFFVLCPRETDSFCECKGDTYLYVPANNSFHSIFKLFSFSHKNDLINSINKNTENELSKHDYKNYCQLVSRLRD